MKNNDTLLLVGIAALGYYIYTKKDQVSTVPVDTVPFPDVSTIIKYPIVYGRYHPDVKALQAALGVKQDGVIGPQTLIQWKRYLPTITRFFSIANVSDLNAEVKRIKYEKNKFYNPSPPIFYFP